MLHLFILKRLPGQDLLLRSFKFCQLLNSSFAGLRFLLSSRLRRSAGYPAILPAENSHPIFEKTDFRWRQQPSTRSGANLRAHGSLWGSLIQQQVSIESTKLYITSSKIRFSSAANNNPHSNPGHTWCFFTPLSNSAGLRRSNLNCIYLSHQMMIPCCKGVTGITGPFWPGLSAFPRFFPRFVRHLGCFKRVARCRVFHRCLWGLLDQRAKGLAAQWRCLTTEVQQLQAGTVLMLQDCFHLSTEATKIHLKS